jgi:probable HAF family extracellular repeat protein
MKDLGVPPGATDTSANAINHMGTVVGSAYVGGANYHAFVYAMGKITDLNTLIPASYGVTLTNAVAINNEGQIAATGYVGTNTSATQAYVLTPCVTFNVQLSAVYGPGGIALNEMKAVFTPASGQAISEAAAACGFVGFNFRQWVTNRPCPSPLSLLPTDPAKLPKTNYCSVDENGNPTSGLTAPPEFPDPPPGSYNKDKYNPYPYYYEWQGAELWMTSSWMTSVYFADAPGDVCLPATDLGTLLLQPAQCILPIDPSGYQGFTTTLVGMIAGNPPTPSVPLCTWTWRSLWTGVATNLGDVENISAAQGSCTKQ